MPFARPSAAVLILVACAGLPVAPAIAAGTPASPHERLVHLAEAMVQADAAADPLSATALGIPGHDGELPPPSEARRAAEVARVRAWSAQVAAIVGDAGPALSLVDRDDARLLQAGFDHRLDALLVRRTDRKDYAAPALDVVNALFTQFLHLPVPGEEGATTADRDRAWADITQRLERAPAYVEAGQRLVTMPGRLFGTVGAKQVAGAPDFLAGALGDAAREQLAGDPAALARFEAARDAFLRTLAATRATLAAKAASWPDNHAIGRAGYDAMLRRDKLLPFDSMQLLQMAQDELAHGWAEEAWLAALSRQRDQPFGAASGGGMAPGGPALVGYYRDRIAQLKDFIAANDVVTIPGWLGEMKVVETPKFLQPVSPGASMDPPRLFAPSTTGHYFITPPESLEAAAQRLDMNEDFDRDRILSTAAHEAMPGHFLQLSIARRHPDLVRRIQYSPEFAEGWAFYGEEMFVRLGLYGDDLDARLFTARWERVRGARVIVDVRLATGEWTLAQAARFYEEQAGFTPAAAEAAVAGIALRPGYVVAYTVGRLQLETLLGDYQRRMGARGSLRDFHDRLLSYGSVPFAIVGPELLADLGQPAQAVRAAANY